MEDLKPDNPRPNNNTLSKKMFKAALALQRQEINEYHIYSRLADFCRDPHNAQVLRSVSEAEKGHAGFWQGRTGITVTPNKLKTGWTILQARLLGLTFVLKRMEKNEGTASKMYMELYRDFPETKTFSEAEAAHERELLEMLDEERLRYAGSVVLGLNDALVELTGALAGFTLALGETRLISLAGLITGISAAFSMAASEYLSCKADNDPRAVKSALYTGFAYIITVAVLIAPFLIAANKFIALGVTLSFAVLVIFCFNYYLAVARDLDFKRRFTEMTLISMGVAALSFGVGWLLKMVLGI
ncbi:MAG: VIT1/CCC1 transporter family protein [Treponema sp.]|jgi:VIT1/CCC1 family predicted Fe2+/Mn2+ transporter|nr:VIT1/CCC1 transporter family protein [Treponema sp.]